MTRTLKVSAIIALLSVLLYGCAPGAITPSPLYENGGLATGPYPASTRSGHFDEDGFSISAGPVGLGLEVAQGPWRGVLYGGYNGAAGRVSWSQGRVGASLDMAYNSYTSWDYVDADNDGIYETEVEVITNTVGAALDVAYYLKVPTEVGAAYAGPRGRVYFACVQENSAPFRCNRYGVLPGGMMGINVPLSVFSDRLTLGFEGSLFLVVPGITDRTGFSVFSPFSMILSYRF
jgi:hypothetical protein